jgi:hypothetical protein
MRGRRGTLAAALAEALASRPGGHTAALAAAFADACGPRIACEASFRGSTSEGRLLIVVRTAAWAEQVAALEPEICARVEARLGRDSAPGLDIHVGEVRERGTPGLPESGKSVWREPRENGAPGLPESGKSVWREPR